MNNATDTTLIVGRCNIMGRECSVWTDLDIPEPTPAPALEAAAPLTPDDSEISFAGVAA